MPVLYCCIEHERPEVGCRKLSIAHGPRLFVNIFQPAQRLLKGSSRYPNGPCSATIQFYFEETECTLLDTTWLMSQPCNG